MAVKVIVCGDGNGDYEFLVATVNRKRLFNEEILELLDNEGNLLYTVPIHSLRLMQLFPIDSEQNDLVQKYQFDNSITSICFDNGNGNDAIVECTTANSDRFVNEVIIETNNYLGTTPDGKETWSKEFIIPLKHVKFINHNHIVEDSSKVPTQNPKQEVSNAENVSEDVEEITDINETVETPKTKKHRFKK